MLGRSFAEQALCGRILETLFTLMTPSSPLSLAISCWEVRHTGVVDLLAPDEAAAVAAAAGGEFASAHAPTLQEALELVALGVAAGSTRQHLGSARARRVHLRTAPHSGRGPG